jgi:type II secretory pathway predicted ATPase ExeA
VRCHLDALKEDEVGNYINHRLKVAGREEAPNNQIFSPEAIKAIFQHTGGIPRRINTLGDLVLMEGFAKRAQKIDKDVVNAVIKDFSLR